ncbi:MAG: universal stress protein [Methanomassiliicoccales archaeon]|nr:universal stress protein [Methanomassiliicoccales archaeon]NYT15529.1 universal stress protein [Methanomassiliicoccales archaeon]
MFARILIPVDFSDQSLQMFQCVAQFCGKGNEEMILLNVMAKGDEVTDDQERKVQELIDSITNIDIKARFSTEIGSPVESILDVAKKESITMIAMASSGKGMAREFIVGSTCLGVIRNSLIPVFLDKFEVTEEEGELVAVRRCANLFRTAIVPLDFSSCNKPVLEQLQYLIDNGLEKAVLFHTIDSSKYRVSDDTRFQWVKEELNKIKGELEARTCDISTHVHFGSLVYNILEVSREFNASLIMMGTHGKSLLHEMTLGSVSEEVIRKATVSLLIIPCIGRG